MITMFKKILCVGWVEERNPLAVYGTQFNEVKQ